MNKFKCGIEVPLIEVGQTHAHSTRRTGTVWRDAIAKRNEERDGRVWEIKNRTKDRRRFGEIPTA
jgi:hypothetical protein